MTQLLLLCLFFLCGSTSGLQIPRSKNREKILHEEHVPKKRVVPMSVNQKQYADVLHDFQAKIVIGTGPAGTGKTLFPCLESIDMLSAGKINKIVITRPLVTVEEDLGFLPGNLDDKMSPWTRPIFDIFLDTYSKKELDKMLFDNTIEIAPLAFMRGRTFKDACIIADEMQNCSPGQMEMLTTRIGKGSRLFITGDLNQSDRGDFNGLKDIVTRISAYYETNPAAHRMVELVSLDADDVQRSKIVKHMIDIYGYNRRRLYDYSNDIIAC
jgi:phosphate starvation-inducible PhoH-like protein